VLGVAIAALGLLSAAAPLRAHHAFASTFDANKFVKLEGVVTKMEWINPHSWMHIDVKKTDGTVEKWRIEAGTPNSLFRMGVTKDSLPIGAEVVVEGYQAKDGTLRANGRDLTFRDGRRLFLGQSGTGAPYEKP
jgi:hypothetical protein